MPEINSNYNLDAHYTNEAKVKRSGFKVASPPANLPKQHLFNDIDANNRMKMINQDIYQSFKKEENKEGIQFLKFFGALVGAVLLIKGFQHILNIFKKS